MCTFCLCNFRTNYATCSINYSATKHVIIYIMVLLLGNLGVLANKLNVSSCYEVLNSYAKKRRHKNEKLLHQLSLRLRLWSRSKSTKMHRGLEQVNLTNVFTWEVFLLELSATENVPILKMNFGDRHMPAYSAASGG